MLNRLAAIAAGLMFTLAPAAAQEKIKFTLDWKIQGIHADVTETNRGNVAACGLGHRDDRGRVARDQRTRKRPRRSGDATSHESERRRGAEKHITARQLDPFERHIRAGE